MLDWLSVDTVVSRLDCFYQRQGGDDLIIEEAVRLGEKAAQGQSGGGSRAYHAPAHGEKPSGTGAGDTGDECG